MTPGSIVRCRNRNWVLLPSDSEEVHLLRPLAGTTEDVVAVNRRLSDLIGASLPEERVRPSQFPLPTPGDLADAAGAHLLWQAARLSLRDGAGPFRSLGRISIRPRIYQFVPLLMALRLDPVRLLIADDVGVGKTIEALMIARELLDRGEARRLCVLCPPYLCDQWQKELREKANLDAVVIRSGTIGQLDRRTTSGESIYQHYPIQVASIDFLKTDRNRHQFIQHCPDLVIVDEAHGAADTTAAAAGRQQRHRLLQELTAGPDRHILLLTATPHSGVEGAFRSLLALLRPEFAGWDTAALAEPQRAELARYFVQRTRADIERDWEGERCFPRRDPSDETYRLSAEYQDLFRKTFTFCSEMVLSGESLGLRQRRVRYWAALALLRCVMSSPAAAVAALQNRGATKAIAEEEEDADFTPYVYESADDQTDDGQPTPPIEAAETLLADTDRRRLGELRRAAEALRHTRQDGKLTTCIELVAGLLRDGYHPILWCRYIATATYLAEGLQQVLRRSSPGVQIVVITSQVGDDEERRAKLAEISLEHPRVLVATDCLSEGINLQDSFNAALHYDLPWNPNRLEQREGRVDRYGQMSKVVRTIRYFSPDSAIDGIVLNVLLNKAREIHKALGTYVPVPQDSESVTEALLQALFLSKGRAPRATQQMELDFDLPPNVQDLHRRWQLDAERERVNRSRFAQRALRPAEVRAELETSDAVLGDPDAVRRFVLDAAQRLGLSIRKDGAEHVFRVAVAAESVTTLPEVVRSALPTSPTVIWRISFVSPTPQGATYLGRNHSFVAALAQFLMEEALARGDRAHAARCGVIRTRAVARPTTLLLLRARYLLEQPRLPALLAEEVIVKGITGAAGAGDTAWLDDDAALQLLGSAQPDANVPMDEKRAVIEVALGCWGGMEAALDAPLAQRAATLEQSHRRVRQTVGLAVRGLTLTPQPPPDLLGLLVLLPVA